MIFLLFFCFSFILLSNLSLKTLRPSSLAWIGKTMISITSFEVSSAVPPEKESINLKAKSMQEIEEISLLDLPELALECILEQLSPAELCSVAGVCSSLRGRCVSDHLWKRYMKQKWGRLIGDAAFGQWQWHLSSRKRSNLSNGTKQRDLLGYVSWLWPVFINRSKPGTSCQQRGSLPVGSIMAWYLALESGKLWFPAQVYNREHGNVGFMLSCYDAEVSYECSTDTFKARYSRQGRRTTEESIKWNRLRAPAVDTPAHVLHSSDCLEDLIPGDHIEIQWRRNKEFPYGWWYGVVSHLESCSGNGTHCNCHCNDIVMLEFKQYCPASQWRRLTVNRKDHRVVGNEADGFYGGIRKLYDEEEIKVWKCLWPTRVLE